MSVCLSRTPDKRYVNTVAPAREARTTYTSHVVSEVPVVSATYNMYTTSLSIIGMSRTMYINKNRTDADISVGGSNRHDKRRNALMNQSKCHIGYNNVRLVLIQLRSRGASTSHMTSLTTVRSRTVIGAPFGVLCKAEQYLPV